MVIDPAQFDEELQQLLVELQEDAFNAELIARICFELNIRSFHQHCIEMARHGLAANPWHANIYYELIIASSLDTAHVLEEICAELEALLESRPGDDSLRRNLALVNFFLEADEEAENLLSEIIHNATQGHVDTHTYEILAQLEHAHGNFEDCIEYCDIAIDKPGSPARVVRLKGLCFQEMNRIDKALDCYNQALELEPHFVWACHSLAALYFEKKDYLQAFRYFGKACYINPGDPGNLFILAEAFMDMEAYDIALAELQKLLLCKPPKRIEAEVHNALGYLWIRKENPDKAREHLVQAIELEPELSVAYFNLGQLALSQKQTSLAERHFKNALTIDPLHMESWLELGFLQVNQDKAEGARECFQKALELEPEEAQAYLGLSKVAHLLKKREEQLTSAKRAFELSPDDAEIANYLGIAFECNDSLDKAEIYYRRALELEPLHSPAANNLGYLFEKKMGLYPEERETYRKKAVDAWRKRLNSCLHQKKSIQAAVTHLTDLGVPREEIDALAQMPYEVDH